jgi:peptidoglycan hydrolase-like protein with peptidoglycan-binding domain
MTPQNARRVLSTFVLLSMGVMINILVMQPMGSRPAGPRASKPDVLRDTAPIPTAPPQSTAPQATAPAAAAKPSAPTTNAAGDNPDVVTAIQRELAARDYDLGAPDGTASPTTRAAIMAWEHDNKLTLTGEPTAAVLKAIILGADATTAAQIAAELKALPREREPRTQHLIRSVQQALADLGYVLGAASGQMNDDTARAIREFEQEQTLPATGRISATLITRLTHASKATGSSALR